MTLRLREGYPNLGILLAAWTLLGCAAFGRHVLFLGPSSINVWLEFAGWLASFCPWAFLSPLIFGLEQRFPLKPPHFGKNLAWLTLASVPFVWAACKVAIVLQRIIFRTPQMTPAPWWVILHCEFWMQQALFWLAVGGACVLRNLIEHQDTQRLAAQMALEKSELESSLRQAELATLRMRLNPHFLFNCLQNISTLTRLDPDTASQMLTRLGDLLRSALAEGAEAETTLASEIELTRAYAAIEQMRFQDRISVLFDVEADMGMALVPTFLLQPLVENAIKHGLRESQQGGVIWVRAARQQGQLALSVSDNGAGFSRQNLAEIEMGIGLGATSERLNRMFPDEHTFSMQQLVEGGAAVHITIPLRLRQSGAQEGMHGLAAVADCR